MPFVFNEIPVKQLLFAVTGALDIADEYFRMHAIRVLFASLRIGEELNLDNTTLKRLFMAAILHDVGVLSDQERAELMALEVPQDKVELHSRRGKELLQSLPGFENLASIVGYHHHPVFAMPETEEAFLANIIHLADRIVVAAGDGLLEPGQVEESLGWVRENAGIQFDPRIVAAFDRLTDLPSFWLDLTTDYVWERAMDYSYLIADKFVDPFVLGRLFAKMIDLRSPFTSRHSFLVASTARRLGQEFGLSQRECNMLELAGLLHDLGKLAVPNSILEKEGKLTYEERNHVTVHPYFTYQLLNGIPGLEMVKEWAAFHHERMDGRGYPFQIPGENLSLGSRVLAVADVYAALSEKRPYKDPLPQEEVIAILRENAAGGGLDPHVVETVAKLPVHVDSA